MKTVLFSLLFAFIAQLAFAIPPACLLHAVNTQDEPGDLNSVCGNGALTVQSHMAINCGKWEQDAQKAFIATCSSAGKSVAAYTASATSSGSSASRTGTVTSARSSGSATGTAGSTQSTAGAHAYRGSRGPMAAAAVMLVGAVAAL